MTTKRTTKENITIDYSSKDYCNIVEINMNAYNSLNVGKFSLELCQALRADLYQLKEDKLSLYIDKEKRKQRYQDILTQKQNSKKKKDKERKSIQQKIEHKIHKTSHFLELRLEESKQLWKQMKEISKQKREKQQNEKEFKKTWDDSKMTFNFEINDLKEKEKELSKKYEKVQQKIQEYQNYLLFLEKITNPKERNYLTLDSNRSVKKKLDSYLLAKSFIEETIQDTLAKLLSSPKKT